MLTYSPILAKVGVIKIKALKRVLVILLMLVILSAGVLTVWQWENIKPMILGRVLSEEKLGDMLEQQIDEQKKSLEEQGVTVQGPSSEQVDQMLHGKLDGDSVITQLHLDRASTGSAPTTAELMNQCAAKLYSYESQMYTQLGAIWQNAVATWTSHPKEERTGALKNQIKSSSISQCYNLETQSDAMVSATLDEYRAKISAAGGDPSQVDAFWNLYCEKKSSVKAYYYNLIKQK